MGIANGSVLGVTKIVDHGPDVARYNIALVAEGYTSAEMSKWEDDAQTFVNAMDGTPPFSEIDLRAAINVHRLDVVSDQSGADNPVCGDELGDSSTAATYFDATFCGDGTIQRALQVDELEVWRTVLRYVPFCQAVMVIVNHSTPGGTGGVVGVTSTDPDWMFTAVHELGHTGFGLADEYPYYADPGETGHDTYLGGEPDEPNVTALANRDFIKWKSLLTPSTGVPTTQNQDCSAVDPQARPVPVGTVGAFEGARYFHCRLYRPEYDCKMRTQTEPFCKVCSQVIRDTLAPYAQPTTVTLLSPTVAIPDTEEGTTAPGAVALAVDSWVDLSFWVADWPRRTDGGPEDFGGAPVLDLPLGRLAESPGQGTRTAYVWLSYQGTAPGDSLTGTVTVECNETGQSFTVPITANTVERVTVGVVLSLDKSGSMLEPAAGGGTKGEALQDAAETFVDIMPDDDGVGVNTFATDVDDGTTVEVAGGVFGNGRSEARDYIRDEYEPIPPGASGGTSIGDGIEASDSRLSFASADFEELAMVIFTDGKETAPKFISEVSGLISANPRIFAIGLGTPENLDPATLATLCSGSGGELLLTGSDEGDTFLLLAKYFLKILAGVTNTEIVLDPEGYLAPDAGTVRIDFKLNETDTGADVVLVTPVPSAVRFALETPTGDVIAPTAPVPGTTHVRGARNAYYRVSLPAPVNGQPVRDGTWYALLSLDMNDWTAGDNAPLLYRYLQQHPSALANGLPYSLSVQARSNLKLLANCLQDSYEPGAELRVRGVLTEYGLPIDGRATVRADMTRPDGTAANLSMAEIEPGVFETVETAHQTGVYQFHVLADGETLRGYDFTREQLVTGFTYHGGDNPPAPGDGGQGHGDNDDWCRLLECLIGALTPEACERLCIDRDRLQRCVSRHCRGNRITTSTAPVDIDPADIDLVRDASVRLGLTSPASARPADPARRVRARR